MRNFILKNSKWIRPYLLTHIPLDVEFLKKFTTKNDWQYLSFNPYLDVDMEFIREHEEDIVWEDFNPLLSEYFHGEGRDARIIKFFDRYKNLLNWSVISTTIGDLEDCGYMLKRYADHFDWSYICFNYRIAWDHKLMREFRHVIDWDYLVLNPSLEWTRGMLEDFEDEINWIKFYHHADYKWDHSSITRFRHHLERIGAKLDELYYHATFPGKTPSSRRKAYEEFLDLRQEETEAIKDKQTQFLKTFDDAYDLAHSLTSVIDINFNRKLKWSEEAFAYILSHKDADILHLSTHSNLINPAETLHKHANTLIWDKQVQMIFFDGFNEEVKQDVPGGVSANLNIRWTDEMLEEHKDRLNWEVLSLIGNIEWTPQVLARHFHRFNKEKLFRQEMLYENLIYPALNEELLEVVIGST